MVDENRLEIQDAQSGDVAIFAGDLGEIFQRIVIERPERPLVLTCHGQEYDDSLAATAGHFMADLGFEHFFTGHGGLLAPGAASNPFNSSDHPMEHTFQQWMAASGNLKEYHAKTRENIKQLFNWVEAIERALPVERSELWSEGEENFEARLDAILGQH